MKGGPNIGKADMALFNAALYLNRSFIAAFRSINYEMSQEIIDAFDRVLKALAH